MLKLQYQAPPGSEPSGGGEEGGGEEEAGGEEGDEDEEEEEGGEEGGAPGLPGQPKKKRKRRWEAMIFGTANSLIAFSLHGIRQLFIQNNYLFLIPYFFSSCFGPHESVEAYKCIHLCVLLTSVVVSRRLQKSHLCRRGRCVILFISSIYILRFLKIIFIVQIYWP